MSSTYRWFVAAGAALAFAAPLSAQQAPVTDVGPVATVSAVQAATPAPTPLFGPTLEGTALTMRIAPVATPNAAAIAPLPAQGPQSANVALMIVGGAGLVIGSIIGGDTGTIIMVGGGAVALVGLYRYLR